MARRSWSDLGPVQRRVIVVTAAAQVGMAVAAWADLYRRPRELVRGPKAAWAFGIAVNFAGPLAYARWGRRRA